MVDKKIVVLFPGANYNTNCFEECNRVSGQRTVRGQLYDGLTFKLNKEKYNDFHEKYKLSH